MYENDIQIISLQSTHAYLNGWTNRVRTEIGDTFCCVAELCAEDDFFTHGLQSLAEQFLAPSPAVAWRGVKEVAACLERFLYNAQALTFAVGSPFWVCQLPCPKPDLGDVHACIAKRTKFHVISFHNFMSLRVTIGRVLPKATYTCTCMHACLGRKCRGVQVSRPWERGNL